MTKFAHRAKRSVKMVYQTPNRPGHVCCGGVEAERSEAEGFRPCGYRMEIYQPLRTGLWLLHGRRPGRCTFTTLYPAADKYPYMFKIVLVICTLGNPCVQFQEDTHRTYATQDQCLDRAEIKYQQVTQTLQANGFVMADSGYYCVQDDTI